MEKSMISLCLLGGLAIGNGFAQTSSKPNILLIIADDCSYYDIGCFGAVNNKTPHIDARLEGSIRTQKVRQNLTQLPLQYEHAGFEKFASKIVSVEYL